MPSVDALTWATRARYGEAGLGDGGLLPTVIVAPEDFERAHQVLEDYIRTAGEDEPDSRGERSR
jgi:hypothetical protein